MTERATRKVLMSPELMEQWATRDEFGNRLRWDWRQPDGEWWEPTISVDYADNLVAAERARIAEAVRKLWADDDEFDDLAVLAIVNPKP